jgi:hypothetical protein
MIHLPVGRKRKYAESILHGKRDECKIIKRQRLFYRCPLFFLFRKGLYLYDVGGLVSLGSLGYLERNPLSLVKSFEAIALDGAEMDENVPAIIAGKKTIALGRIEPLNCSLGCQNCSS